MDTLTIDSFQFLWAQFVNDASRVRNILAVLGAIYVGKGTLEIVIPLIRGISTHGFSRLWPVNLRKCGTWAVVTGPTEGIGKSFAMQLAKQGLNILLLGRNADKLLSVADYIEQEYKVETKIQIVDFNNPGESYVYLQDTLQTIDVALFVNNAGVINSYPSFIYELSDDIIERMINVNIKAVTFMTKLGVEYLRSKSEGFRGIIVNVSSIASIAPGPLLAVYAATKAYVTSFSRAVHEEVCREGITVQTLIPSYVKTRMVSYSTRLHESWFVPTPETYAAHAVCTLGYSSYTTGYWMHGLQAFIASLVPVSIWTSIIRRGNLIFRSHYISGHRD